MTQAPALHVDVPLFGVPQTLPQAPQLFVSLLVYTHPPLQAVYPPLQISRQAPEMHGLVPLFAVPQPSPQAPRLETSVDKLTHVPLQLTRGTLHPHTPELQVTNPLQA